MATESSTNRSLSLIAYWACAPYSTSCRLSGITNDFVLNNKHSLEHAFELQDNRESEARLLVRTHNIIGEVV